MYYVAPNVSSHVQNAAGHWVEITLFFSFQHAHPGDLEGRRREEKAMKNKWEFPCISRKTMNEGQRHIRRASKTLCHLPPGLKNIGGIFASLVLLCVVFLDFLFWTWNWGEFQALLCRWRLWSPSSFSFVFSVWFSGERRKERECLATLRSSSRQERVERAIEDTPLLTLSLSFIA